MNPVLLSIILIPILEIYLFIKIGSQIGAFNTILLIFLTAIIGIYYAKYEGLNTIRSGFMQIVKNQTPAYEIISGAAIAFAAILLILPGFATDFLGFLLIFPITRKLIFGNLSNKFKKKDQVNEKNFIDGEYEDVEEDDDLPLDSGKSGDSSLKPEGLKLPARGGHGGGIQQSEVGDVESAGGEQEGETIAESAKDRVANVSRMSAGGRENREGGGRAEVVRHAEASENAIGVERPPDARSRACW